MTNWKREDRSALECVIENTGSKLCPIVSVLVDGTMTCYGEDGQYIRGPAKGNLTKAHPCDNLREGDLVMVWDDDTEIANAVTRRFQGINKSGTVLVSAPDKVTLCDWYTNGMPPVDWVVKIL